MRSRRHFLLSAASPALAQDWPQWGGPQRDFHSPALRRNPTLSPLWKRELGDGVSSIAVQGSSAFTLYRSGTHEIVVSFHTSNGVPRWEYSYPTVFRAGNPSAGHGPRAMPQIFGDLLVTVGAGAQLHALNKSTGKLAWSHDLYHDFNATEMGYGYSSHPLLYRNTLILMTAGLVALDAATGKPVWQTSRFKSSNSSPILIESEGRKQVIAHTASHLIAANPEDGELVWTLPNSTPYGQPILTPIWGSDGLLFVSTAYEGSQMLAVSSRSARIRWANERVRVYYSSAVRLGDTIYASSGQAGVLVALDVSTGKVQWQRRGYPHAHVLACGNHLLLSTLDGRIDFALPNTTGIDVLASARLLDPPSRTPPTLAGDRLFLRDNRHLLAVSC